MLFPNSQIGFKDITDGSSNTAAISEQSDFIYTQDGTKNPWNAGYPNAWTIGAAATTPPPNYNAGGDNRSFVETTIRYAINLKKGPNGTGWTNGGDCPGLGVCVNIGNNIPLNSAHPGGVNCLLCDGSVRFVSEYHEPAVGRPTCDPRRCSAARKLLIRAALPRPGLFLPYQVHRTETQGR